MCCREPDDGSHAPAGVRVDGDREHFPANPDTATTAATNHTCSHEQTIPSSELTPVTTEYSRNEEISWFEYLEHLLANTSDDEKVRMKETMSRAPRPNLARCSFTREDYFEISAAWNEVTLRWSSLRRKPSRIAVVHSITVRNTAHHGMKRARFGRDRSLKSDR